MYYTLVPYTYDIEKKAIAAWNSHSVCRLTGFIVIKIKSTGIREGTWCVFHNNRRTAQNTLQKTQGALPREVEIQEMHERVLAYYALRIQSFMVRAKEHAKAIEPNDKTQRRRREHSKNKDTSRTKINNRGLGRNKNRYITTKYTASEGLLLTPCVKGGGGGLTVGCCVRSSSLIHSHIILIF